MITIKQKKYQITMEDDSILEDRMIFGDAIHVNENGDLLIYSLTDGNSCIINKFPVLAIAAGNWVSFELIPEKIEREEIVG